MALSEVDYILIEKHGEGKLTPKEFAMWSKRMQDQEFVQAWHAKEDERMAKIGAFLDELRENEINDEKESGGDEPGEMSQEDKWNTIFNMAIMIFLALILIAFIIMLISPESWVKESSFSEW